MQPEPILLHAQLSNARIKECFWSLRLLSGILIVINVNNMGYIAPASKLEGADAHRHIFGPCQWFNVPHDTKSHSLACELHGIWGGQ